MKMMPSSRSRTVQKKASSTRSMTFASMRHSCLISSRRRLWCSASVMPCRWPFSSPSIVLKSLRRVCRWMLPPSAAAFSDPFLSALSWSLFNSTSTSPSSAVVGRTVSVVTSAVDLWRMWFSRSSRSSSSSACSVTLQKTGERRPKTIRATEVGTRAVGSRW